MKQLLIVKNNAVFSGTDLSQIADGQLYINTLSNGNKSIALGRPNNSPAFIIPEVDMGTLTVFKAAYNAGTKFKATLTLSSVTAGKDYTLVLVKNGTVPHERNTWTATYRSVENDTAAIVAGKLRNYFKEMTDRGSIDIVVSGTGANVVLEGKYFGEGWTLKGADALLGVSFVPSGSLDTDNLIVTPATPAIGDVKYLKDLASRCAAGKGFTDVYADGESVYPGYPEEVPAVRDAGYDIYTLRFAVGRDSAKTRDERVYQIVHIAVPTTYTNVETAISKGLEQLSLSAGTSVIKDGDMTGNGE